MRTVLCTVGTSLVNNIRRELGGQQPIDGRVAEQFLRSVDQVRACAETNSLFRLLREEDRIVFLCSQTEEGKMCADALKAHYQAKKFDARVVQVPDLTYRESRFKMRGLRSLVATLIEHIRQEKAGGREVLINATGGFKAEIAYATLVGLLFDVPVYYIHEAFSDIIEMPPTPIGWDYSLLAEYDEFFAWIQQDLRTVEEVDRRLATLPREIRLLLAEEEGYAMLSPAGEAFYEAYLDRLAKADAVPILLSARAWDAYQGAKPEVRSLFDRVLGKLGLRDLWIGTAEKVGNSDCLVYPRGHRTERLFFYEDDNGNVRVCELVRHGDGSYERLLKHGVWRQNYTDFRPWRPGAQ